MQKAVGWEMDVQATTRGQGGPQYKVLTPLLRLFDVRTQLQGQLPNPAVIGSCLHHRLTTLAPRNQVGHSTILQLF